MQTVLVPVDGSPSATRAVEWAGRVLARQPGAHVHLVNVQPLADAWEVTSHLGEGDVARWQADASAAVLEPAAAVLRQAGVAATPHAVVGDVASSVAEQARALHCDAIVMGTRGLGTVKSLLLGSVTTAVIHQADVPVTLIK
jgi:nucleotide-binding universal stress UspA family protein